MEVEVGGLIRLQTSCLLIPIMHGSSPPSKAQDIYLIHRGVSVIVRVDCLGGMYYKSIRITMSSVHIHYDTVEYLSHFLFVVRISTSDRDY